MIGLAAALTTAAFGAVAAEARSCRSLDNKAYNDLTVIRGDCDSLRRCRATRKACPMALDSQSACAQFQNCVAKRAGAKRCSYKWYAGGDRCALVNAWETRCIGAWTKVLNDRHSYDCSGHAALLIQRFEKMAQTLDAARKSGCELKERFRDLQRSRIGCFTP